MLSKYFEIKTNSVTFKENVKDILEKLDGKRVLLYGVGEAFFALDKIYNFREKLNIIAVADKKFEKDNSNITGLNQVLPDEIKNLEYDFVLVTNEKPRGVLMFLLNNLEIPKDMIITLFNEEIKEEGINIVYLYEQKFDKTLPKLVKKLKGKTVLIYGAGVYFEVIKKYFDLSGLNIIGIADKRFQGNTEINEFLGYKTYAPNQIKQLNPDYVLVATKFYLGMVYTLYYDQLKDSKIKIKPLVPKSFLTLLKEAWG